MNKITLRCALMQKVLMLFLCLVAPQITSARPEFSSRKHVEKHFGVAKLPVVKVPVSCLSKTQLNETPIITSDEPFFCMGGSLLLTASTAETYQWYKDGAPIDGATSQSYTVTENGTYTVRATYAEGPAAFSAGFTAVQSNRWLGTATDQLWNNPLNWSCGVVPAVTDHLIIAEAVQFPVISGASPITVTSLLLEDFAKLTVESGSTLVVTDALTVASTAQMILRDAASLVQISDVANTGNITVEKTTAPMKKYDFTYWSAPVAGQTLHDLSPNTLADKYYSFSPLIGNWVSHLNGAISMEAGIGYIVRAPQTFSPTLAAPYTDGHFVGVPNNGDITVPVIVGTSDMNLIGNPYPSAIDIDLFLQHAANEAVIDGTIYLWTHHSAPALIPGDNTYNYSSNDYASYNLLGGIASGNNEKPTGKVASGQSFFIKAVANASVVFNNNMRVAFSNDQFFRNAAANTTQSLEKHRVWLNFSNSQGAFKQTLLGFVDGATDDTDRNFDGLDFNGNTFVNFYTIANDSHYNIQGRALPFDENVVIPLGYSTTISGAFNISLAEFDGVFETQDVLLYDAFDSTFHDLKNNSYEFATAAGTFNDRFELRFMNPLRTESFEEVSIAMAYAESVLKIKASEKIESVAIADLSGRKLFGKNNIDATEIQLADLTSTTTTVVLVKITLANGQTIVKKTILE